MNQTLLEIWYARYMSTRVRLTHDSHAADSLEMAVYKELMQHPEVVARCKERDDIMMAFIIHTKKGFDLSLVTYYHSTGGSARIHVSLIENGNSK